MDKKLGVIKRYGGKIVGPEDKVADIWWNLQEQHYEDNGELA